MYAAPGIGLAAIQVGEPRRIVTLDLAKKDEPKDAAGVHQSRDRLDLRRARTIYEEGCLSIPEYYEEVERPAEVKVSYLDLDGKQQRGRGRRPARDLPAARDRPPQRRAVHRPHLQAQARPGDQEVHQGGQARRQAGGRTIAAQLVSADRSPQGWMTWLNDMALRLIFMGTPEFAVPTLLELAGARP